MTITEALAGIKTIGKRIATKRESISAYIARQDNLKDPLANFSGHKLRNSGPASHLKDERCFADALNTERARLHQSHHHADAP